MSVSNNTAAMTVLFSVNHLQNSRPCQCYNLLSAQGDLQAPVLHPAGDVRNCTYEHV